MENDSSRDRVQTIDWPKAKIGGQEFTFRLSYPAHSQLFAWGFGGVSNVPVAAWAAAMAGTFNRAGKWKSAGFKSWLDVADAVLDDEQQALSDAIDEAIKKASPESTVKVEQPTPAPTEPQA